MNIREQIAQICLGIDLCTDGKYIQEEWDNLREVEKAIYFGYAEAILALLQPRMLTKDEAYVAEKKWECSNSCRSCDYQDDCHALMPKLKLIQEEE